MPAIVPSRPADRRACNRHKAPKRALIHANSRNRMPTPSRQPGATMQPTGSEDCPRPLMRKASSTCTSGTPRTSSSMRSSKPIWIWSSCPRGRSTRTIWCVPAYGADDERAAPHGAARVAGARQGPCGEHRPTGSAPNSIVGDGEGRQCPEHAAMVLPEQPGHAQNPPGHPARSWPGGGRRPAARPARGRAADSQSRGVRMVTSSKVGDHHPSMRAARCKSRPAGPVQACGGQAGAPCLPCVSSCVDAE